MTVEYAHEPTEQKEEGGRPVAEMLEVLQKGPAWWPEDADFDFAITCAQHNDEADYKGRPDFHWVWR